MKFQKYAGLFIMICCFVLASAGPAFSQDDPRVKPLLQEALRLYGDRQYVRALDLFKQVKAIEPENSTANEYIESTQKRIMEWENLGTEDTQTRQNEPTWDSLMNSRTRKGSGSTLSNAKDIVAARRSLVSRMKNRSLNTDNIIQIQDNKRGISITLFHDQLFLPGLQTLRDEALPILANVAELLRTRQDRKITIQSMAQTDSKDPFLLYPSFPIPGMSSGSRQGQAAESSFLFEDVELTRSLILFTYLAQSSMGKSARENSGINP